MILKMGRLFTVQERTDPWLLPSMLTFSFPCCMVDVGCCYSALNKFRRTFPWCKSPHGRAGVKWPQQCCPVVTDRRLSAVVPAESTGLELWLRPGSTSSTSGWARAGWPWSITHQPHCFRGQDSKGGCPTSVFNLHKARGPGMEPDFHPKRAEDQEPLPSTDIFIFPGHQPFFFHMK